MDNDGPSARHHVWGCHNCGGHAGMTPKIGSCPNPECFHYRCVDCPVELITPKRDPGYLSPNRRHQEGIIPASFYQPESCLNSLSRAALSSADVLAPASLAYRNFTKAFETEKSDLIKPRRQSKRISDSSSKQQKVFACPFYKEGIYLANVSKLKPCGNSEPPFAWERLKQHMYDKHKHKIVKAQRERIDYLFKAKYEKQKPREEKWLEVWEVLFPQLPRPSHPFHEEPIIILYGIEKLKEELKISLDMRFRVENPQNSQQYQICAIQAFQDVLSIATTSPQPTNITNPPDAVAPQSSQTSATSQMDHISLDPSFAHNEQPYTPLMESLQAEPDTYLDTIYNSYLMDIDNTFPDPSCALLLERNLEKQKSPISAVRHLSTSVPNTTTLLTMNQTYVPPLQGDKTIAQEPDFGWLDMSKLDDGLLLSKDSLKPDSPTPYPGGIFRNGENLSALDVEFSGHGHYFDVSDDKDSLMALLETESDFPQATADREKKNDGNLFLQGSTFHDWKFFPA